MPRIPKITTVPPCPQFPQKGVTRYIKNEETGAFYYDYEPKHLAKLQSGCDEINARRENERIKKQKQRDAVYAVRDLSEDPDGPELNYDNPDAPEKEEARELLKRAGVEHPGAITMLLRNTKIACEAAGVPHNRHSYLHGVLSQHIRKCKILKQEIGDVALLPDDQWAQQDEPLWLKKELDFFYSNYSAFVGDYAGRPQAEWLQDRQIRYDLFGLLTKVFGVPAGPLQRVMCEFLAGDKSAARFLPREYTHQDVQNCLRSYGGPNGEFLQKLLMVFRAAGKTTCGVANVIQNILLMPDFKALIVVESKESALEILTELRGRLEVGDFATPNKFASLWPEHVMPSRTAKTNFKSPLRRLGLKGPTVGIASPNSSTSSLHMDLLYWDDFLGNEVGVSDDPKRHELLLKKGDLQLSLLDGWGTHIIACTPYAPGDIYSVYIKRNEARNGNLKIMRQPIWEVLPEFKDIEAGFPMTLPQLQEHMVDFKETTGRILFQQMKDRAIDNWVDFQRQRLVIPAFSEDHSEGVFSRDDLEACVIHESQVPVPANYHCEVVVDPSHFGTSVQADETAIATVCKWRNPETGVEELFVRDVKWTKDQPAAAAVLIASSMPEATYRNCRLVRISVEKGPSNQLFEEKIIEAARLRSYGDIRPLLSFFAKDKTKGAKENRIKAVQLLVKAREIKFVAGPWNDGLFEQFLRFDPKRGTGHGVKDDRADVVSLAVMLMRGPTIVPKAATAPIDKSVPRNDRGQTAEEFAKWNEDRQNSIGYSKAMHDRIWGASTPQKAAPQKPAPQKPESEWTRVQGIYVKTSALKGTPVNNSQKRNRYGVPTR